MTYWHEINTVMKEGIFFTSEAIFRRVRKINPDASLTSIRRMLKKMSNNGTIERVICITATGRMYLYRKPRKEYK